MPFTNNMDRRWSGAMKRWAWSLIHFVWYPASVFAENWLYCVGLLELCGYINFVNFTNCPRTFGGHCISVKFSKVSLHVPWLTITWPLSMWVQFLVWWGLNFDERKSPGWLTQGWWFYLGVRVSPYGQLGFSYNKLGVAKSLKYSWRYTKEPRQIEMGLIVIVTLLSKMTSNLTLKLRWPRPMFWRSV